MTIKFQTIVSLVMTVFLGGLAFAVAASASDEPASSQIDLIYVWTAHDGMEEQLIGAYAAVGAALEAGEPGLLTYEISISETGHQLVIREVFENNAALAMHLNGTAAQYFPQISEFATPGPFIFRGQVDEGLRQAAYGMNMGAIFTTDWNGFNR
jgi:quinol monooxygenase YgiN